MSWKKKLAAATALELEDIYRPYKQKRRTRAMIAKEKGRSAAGGFDFCPAARRRPAPAGAGVCERRKRRADAQTAVQLAQDILAEQISDDAAIRASLRALYRRTGMSARRRRQRGRKRLRAVCGLPRTGSARGRDTAFWPINRGEREEWLKVAVECDDEQALQIICRAVIRPGQRLLRRGARGGEGRVGQAHQPVAWSAKSEAS